jgi:hypothetical protein
MKFEHDTFMGKSKECELFIQEIIAVCEKHKMSIAHDDTNGKFIILPHGECWSAWLTQAQDCT